MLDESRNLQLERDDKQYVWHPFTQMKDYLKEKPLIIEKGEGSYLWDIYGNRYLDGISSLWVTIHGHCRKEIDEAIIDQVKRVSHSTLLGLSHPSVIELSRRLVEITPERLNKVFYSDAGATAVEIALKMAFQYWMQRPGGSHVRKKYIILRNAYHGDTIGAVSVGGIDLFHRIYEPLLFEVIKVESPYCYRCSLGKEFSSCNIACLAHLEDTIKKHHHETSALIIEPIVQGAAGMLVFPQGYLRRARELCTRYGILMIADEVAVGFGRTGRMFACEHEDVRPDIMTLGKGITGGYLPLAATVTTDEIYDAFLGEFDEFKTFYHGHTYTGNPLACRAALASLDIFTNDDILNKLKVKIDFLKCALKRFNELKHVGDIRQFGFMVGIELVFDKNSKESYHPGDKMGIRVIMEARKRGVIIRPLGDVIILMPPLSIEMDELEELIYVVFDSIRVATEN
ncbi:MAG: adenosylmethionine--8-amino-7-oxononanoate transaminase [Spirochaetota bacterium]|nr:adenosylmethionine--8-amino-7-oxononanoate transaminase [Spirochaetota bacterium]